MEQHKKKYLLSYIFIALGLTVCLLTGGYFAMRRYYENSDFICGTWINGSYCAGKTVNEVEAELLAENPVRPLQVTDGTGTVQVLDVTMFSENAVNYSFWTTLKRISGSQKPGNWIIDTFHSVHYEVTPEVYVARAVSDQAAETLSCVASAEGVETPRVWIQKTAQGYVLTDEKAHVLNTEKVRDAVYQALLDREETLDLEEAGCYESIAYTAEDEKTIELFGKIEVFQNCGIVYQFGDEQIPVDASVVCDWISVDENDQFILDERGDPVLDVEKVSEFIASLAKEYDTYGVAREFQTTRGDVVTIEGGTYGNKLNQKAEVAYLTEAFLSGVKEVHEPSYEYQAKAQGKNDIGDTYIEVDMGEQMMYFYEQGDCIVETPIVTGDMMRKRDTPAAVCYVYAKQTNRILRGPGYAASVKFWMPVKGGIGIHDASWRSKFGGEIYKTNGSHGCINTPYDAMALIYERAEIGTPVVMFY